MRISQALGKRLTAFLAEPRENILQTSITNPDALAKSLQPGDVLLVEGSSRFSTAIKYLTQSRWSHSALYVGDQFPREDDSGEPHLFLEADIVEGIRSVPLSTFTEYPTRICRPIGLTDEEVQAVIDYVASRMGHKYDLKNIFDLARYLIQTPPVPVQWRRRLLGLGSGDPTKAICSSLLAEAFQIVRYPILPMVEYEEIEPGETSFRQREILHIRHHSLYTPTDFDLSPYFQVIKPTIETGFDPHQLNWALGTPESPVAVKRKSRFKFWGK